MYSVLARSINIRPQRLIHYAEVNITPPGQWGTSLPTNVPNRCAIDEDGRTKRVDSFDVTLAPIGVFRRDIPVWGKVDELLMAENRR